jgi:hypothetical protein
MRISRARWASRFLLASLALGLIPIYSAVAQEPDLVVVSSSASTDFPDSITFDLEADLTGNAVEVELVYQMAHLETMQLLPAEFEQDGTVLRASAFADLEVAFLPVGIDVTFRWIVTLEDETAIESDSATITWLDDRFDWDSLSGEYVEVFGYETSDDFLEDILETAEQSARDLIALYQPESILPIRIWVYETGEDYAGTQAANSEQWAAGSAYPDLQVIHAVIPDGSESEMVRIVPHEISHQILHMATLNPFNAPATWIDEGLAVIAQDGAEDLYDSLVESAYTDEELLSMQGLISAFPFDPSEARMAYAQSYSLVSFILESWGQDGITAIITEYAQTNSHDEVLEEALGVNLADLEQLWLTWLDDQFAQVAA